MRSRERVRSRAACRSVTMGLALTACLASGCQGLTQSRSAEETGGSTPAEAAAGSSSGAAGGRQQREKARVKSETAERQIAGDRGQLEELQRSHQRLEETLSRQQGAFQDLEDRVAKLQLLLFEKEAQLRDSSKRLEEAILEVVRTKAKLRSLESRAEAASTLAEAELAMKAMKTKAAGREREADLSRAEELLRLGAEEFKKENYGGALYVTSQAKSLIHEGEERSLGRERLTLIAGERAFALPVPLKTISQSKLREGPTAASRVLATLEEDTAVTGYSHKGQWVRVRTEDGRAGWMLYKLLTAR